MKNPVLPLTTVVCGRSPCPPSDELKRVGAIDGTMVGADGISVGSIDGLLVGFLVDILDVVPSDESDIDEGLPDGNIEGSAVVGLGVGFVDGCEVG